MVLVFAEGKRVPQILEGIRVIDFGRFIAAPYAAMMLADFGADVVRVERREGGEDRGVGPVTELGEGGLFLNMNRNKRGMTLVLAHPQAGEIVTRLVQTADIVIVNLPFNVMKKLRLDYDSLRTVNEGIILVMASTFGPDGPYRDRVGFDGVAQAMSGAMSLTGFADAPVRSIVPWADYGTALHAAFGALAALYHREQTGQGQLIDVSLMATSAMFMTPLVMERAMRGIRRQRIGNTAYYTSPSDAYQTQDGWVLVPTIGDPMFARWAKLMGREDLIGDPRFGDDISRGDHAEAINEVMVAWCAARTRDEAITQLERARIPCGPVYELDEVLNDPQVRARGLYQESTRHDDIESGVLSPPAVRMSETPGSIRRRAPTLGEHTDEVLVELGFSNNEIAGFRSERVV
jgi:crotonobetainyl-CoA:carnitine CoA-transferase CaiB-like acyl-CoA transferase